MKVWVDGQCFQTESNTLEIGRYVLQLISILSKQGIEIIISLNGNMHQETIAARHYLKRKIPNATVKLWYGTVFLPEAITAYSLERILDEKILSSHINEIAPDIALSVNIFEGIENLASPFVKVKELVNIKTVCLFYDAIPYRSPEIYLNDENVKKSYFRRFDELTEFDTVLCVSEFAKNEFVEIFKRKNCVSISVGLSDDFRTIIDNWSDNKRSLGNYIVYTEGRSWRNSILFLVKAIAHLSEYYSKNLKLIFVGEAKKEKLQLLRDIFTQHDVSQEDLIVAEVVSDNELVDIYKYAIASVQPSSEDGFGLCALEAMASGTPFLYACGGALGEVVQSKEQEFAPEDHCNLSQLLHKIITDDCFKQDVIKHGYRRINKFSWDKCAEVAITEFELLLNKKADTNISSNASVAPIVGRSRLIMDVTSTVQSPVLSGIQRVMHNLSDAFLTQNESSETEIILSYSQNTKDWYQLSSLNKMKVQLNPLNRITYNQGDSYLLLDRSWEFIDGQKQRLIDVLTMGQEVVHGVHDLGPLVMPAMTSEHIPELFRNWIAFILGYSTGIVCVSKSVADELYQLIQHIKLPRPMKIGYFRLGANFSAALPDPVELNYRKTRPTFLMVGTIEPRKGQYYGLKAFETLWARGVDVNLILIGETGWDTNLFQTVLNNHSEKDNRLFWRQGISDSGLAAAYQSTDALIMTSYLEGFGLPIVEAGLHNKPVILSDIPVFREVGEGSPNASYFIPGSIESLVEAVEHFLDEQLGADYTDIKVEWPTWDESARELKEVIINNNWYKYYEPEQILPNVRLTDIGEVTINRALTENEIQHQLRVIEGPFLSSDGSYLRMAIGVKNLSDLLWSSNIGKSKGLGINLSYHLYDKLGSCICYENPRTSIPFVILPGQEIFMPIRLSTDELTTGACCIGLELVQEGVRWFGNEKFVNLLKPFVENSFKATVCVEVNKPELIFFRGPFGPAIEMEQYFLFSVINRDTFALPYYDNNESALFNYALVDKEGHKSNKGVWTISHFDSIEAYNCGYIGLFANIQHIELSVYIEITYKDHTWLFDLNTLSIENIRVERKAKNISFEWIDSLNFEELTSKELPVSFNSETLITLRGFNKIEESHVWMSDLTGEMDISSLIEEETLITKIKVICSPFKEIPIPTELSLYCGEQLIDKKILSSDFMEYSFVISAENMKAIIKKQYRIEFVTNSHAQELEGERMLSICFAGLSFTTVNGKNI